MTPKRASLVLFLAAFAGCGGDQAEPAAREAVLASATPAPAARCDSTGLSSAALSPSPPCVVAFSDPPPASGSVDELQPYFDAYSWKTFVALNWPVRPGTTEPDAATVIGRADAPTVWESWKGAWEIFLEDGAEPSPWGTTGELPEPCRSAAAGGQTHVLPFVGKTPNVLTAFDEPFLTGPLIDQAGNYTRYEILVNEPMFDYIVSNRLYSQEGQIAFARDADFPSDSANTQPALQGAVMVKAAWRVVEEADRARFHVRESLVYTPPSDNPAVEASCESRLMGLVGFHVAHKTVGEPQWLWSTFEHVANAPEAGALPTSGTFNYFDPGCADCPVNQPPPRPWNPNDEPRPENAVQVVRSIPIPPEAKERTDAFHASLRAVNDASVWLNYELISTQWPADGDSPTDPTGDPAPVFLGNTTLETYIQGRVPNVSSSCILCHNNAADTQGRFSDFTYLLQLAKGGSRP
jgi:hypothetical protein